MNETRERIVNISFNLFMQKSYKEVTIKEIVQKVGVSQGAFFHYFKNKEELFLEIIENAFSSATEVYDNLCKDSLYQFYHEYVDYFISNFFIEDNDGEESSFSLNYVTLCLEALRLFPNFREQLFKAHQIELNAWEDIIGSAKSKGEIRSSMKDRDIASIFINTSDGIGLRSIFMRNSGEHVRDNLLTLWDSIYENLKA